MDGYNSSGKKITLDDRMNGSNWSSKSDESLLLSLSKITHHFKKWTTSRGVLKIYCLCKNLMLQIDPLNSRCSQKQKYPKRTLRLKVLPKSSSLKKVVVPKVTLASVNVYNCSSKISTLWITAITLVKLLN